MAIESQTLVLVVLDDKPTGHPGTRLEVHPVPELAGQEAKDDVVIMHGGHQPEHPEESKAVDNDKVAPKKCVAVGTPAHAPERKEKKKKGISTGTGRMNIHVIKQNQ